MEKVALFVDIQNIYYTVKEGHRAHFDYSVFWAEATSGREVVKAIGYAIDRGDPKQMAFQEILRRIGFEIKLKPFIRRRDGSAKGDWDVGITIDLLEYAPQVDVVVLASGDGDFDLAVQTIRTKNEVCVEVYGVPNLTAAALIEAADRYIPIEGKFLVKR
jgi:uncharacterized LabA/DUF88 family protein